MRLILLGCLIGLSSALLEISSVAEPIEGEYIVQFKENIEQSLRDAHIDSVNASSEIMFKYDFHTFQGYSAKMSDKGLALALNSPHVLIVEENGIMRASDEAPQACTTQTGAPWGLVRTSTEDLEITGQYKYESNAGTDVTGYVIDTGLYIGHSTYGGKARYGYNAIGGETDADGNGHGTHVGSTMMSSLYGLSKVSALVGVKVLSSGGSGSTAGVIAGVNWVVTDVNSKSKYGSKTGKDVPAKAVGNMSLGGGRSTTLNNAVNAAVEAEVIMAVAGGNDYGDACNYSPASAELAITVGASSNSDAMASFSNYGSCINIFGPGVGVTGAWIGNPNSDNTISGTSMASPHVAGVAMKLMWENPDYDADKIRDEMISAASANKLSGVRGSPNLLVYNGCFDAKK
jgi:subtilisin family serine protease